MTFFQYHLRRGELDAIAQAIGAELVELPRGKGEDHGGQGGGKKTAKRKTAVQRKKSYRSLRKGRSASADRPGNLGRLKDARADMLAIQNTRDVAVL